MKKRIYSKEIADAIKTFLENDDWRYSFDENRGVFRFGLNLSGKLKHVHYLISVREDDYTVYAIPQIGVDENDGQTMALMAEFICYANYGLNNGNFELDLNDGEIRYKTYVDCSDALPGENRIRGSIYCPAAMFERYGEGIVGILFGGKDPKEAVEYCEMSDAEKCRASLAEAVSAGGSAEEMVARLARRLGIDLDDGETPAQGGDSANKGGDK